MYRIGILASTKGTDLQAIIDEMKEGKMPGIEIACVVSNKRSAYALQRAKKNGIESIFISPKNKTREEYDGKLAEIFKEKKVDLICLIGYMRILQPSFVRQFPRRIINVHPALMPAFSGPGFFGANVHEEILKAGVKKTGCTIHFVDEGVDTGPIIIQEKVKIDSDDTPDTLKGKVQAVEKRLYPEVIRKFAAGEIK
jgi:phosphoribosylglycinamide formyltransferase-1